MILFQLLSLRYELKGRLLELSQSSLLSKHNHILCLSIHPSSFSTNSPVNSGLSIPSYTKALQKGYWEARYPSSGKKPAVSLQICSWDKLLMRPGCVKCPAGRICIFLNTKPQASAIVHSSYYLLSSLLSYICIQIMAKVRVMIRVYESLS